MLDDQKLTKLTLTIDDRTTTWEVKNDECDFSDILEGFLGCMWGQTFVPGTEIHVFKNYLDINEAFYRSQDEIVEYRHLQQIND